MSSNLYLNVCHNPIAKVVYDEITPKSKTCTREANRMPSQITKTDHLPTMNKVPHNQPDMVIWNNQNKTCKIVDICVPLDINMDRRDTTKVNNYAPLISQLQRLYSEYNVSVNSNWVHPPPGQPPGKFF